jgi:hypothetical protein
MRPCDCQACIAPSVAGLGGILAPMNPLSAALPPQPLPASAPERTAFDDLAALASLLSIVINLTR